MGLPPPHHNKWLRGEHLAPGTGSLFLLCPSRTAACSGRSFSCQASPTSLPTGPTRPVPGTAPAAGSGLFPLDIPGTRTQIPMGPRSAKSAQRDGKLQQRWPLGPPLAPSRNSRPWTFAPQLIHSRGSEPPPHAGTDVLTRGPARPKTGRAPEQVARRVSTGPARALPERLSLLLPPGCSSAQLLLGFYSLKKCCLSDG